MIREIAESLAGVHTHTYTSSLLVNNNRINIDKKDSDKTYVK